MKNKIVKNKIFIACITSLTIVSIIGIPLFIAKGQGSNPPCNPNVPSNLKWNTETKEYYDPSRFKWNEKTKNYEDIGITENTASTISSNTDIYEDWINKNKNSNDELDKAIIKYHNDLNLTNPDLMLKSNNSVSINTSSNDIGSLGIPYLREMKKRIENNDIWSTELIFAVSKITGSTYLNQYAGSSNVWINKINNKASEIKDTINNSSTLDESKQQEVFQQNGLLTLPYIKDAVDNGNNKIVKYMPVEAICKYYKLDKNEYLNKDNDFWINWLNSHKYDIEDLRGVTN